MSEYDDQLSVSPRDLRLNKLNRRRLEILERRHDHLLDRVEKDPSLRFDAAECGAIHWAVRVLRHALKQNDESDEAKMVEKICTMFEDRYNDDFECTPAQHHARIAMIWEALGVTGPQDKDCFTLAAEEIKRLRNKDILQIKPLVWVGEGSNMAFAMTAIGDFKCQYASHANKWSAALNGFLGFDVGFAWFDTFEEAKAACEQVYERRVRECLE